MHGTPSPPPHSTVFDIIFIAISYQSYKTCLFQYMCRFETKIHISHVCKNQKRDSPSIFCLLSVNYRPTDECQYFCKNLSSSFTNDLTRRVERFSPGRAGHILGIFLQKTNGTNNVLKIHFSHCKLDGCYRSNLFLKSLLIEVASHVIGENIGLQALGVDKVFKIANSLS